MSQATIGALRVILGLDSAQFTEGLSAAQKHLKSVGDRMQRVGAQMATVGAGLTAAITAPVVAAGVSFARAAIAAEEMQSAFNVSFGAMAADVRRWAETTGNAMGRSTFELQEMALGFNGLFKAGGPVTAQTAEMSRQFTVLAQDLSSFHNVAQQDVFAALRSGLSGEAEPLRRFNVYLTEAAVKAEAMRMGLVGAGGALSEQAKIQARASLIMRGTLEAQGDVIRTAAGTQNQLRALQSQWAELSVTLGQRILPLLTPVVAALNKVALAFSSLSPQVQTFVLIAGAIAAVIGPVLIGLGALVASVGALSAAFAAGGLLAAMAPLIPLLAAVAAGAAVAVGAFLLFRKDVEPVLKSLWSQMTATLGPALADLFETVKGLVTGMASAWKKFFDSEAGQALAKFGAILVEVMGTVLIRTLTAAVRVVDGALKVIGNLFSILGDLLTGDFSGAWNGMKALVGNVIQTVLRVIEAFVPGAIDAMRRLVEGVKMWLAQKLVEVFRGVVDRIKVVKDAFFNLYDAVVGHSYVPDMVEGIAEWMAKLDAGMVQPARNATDKTREAFENLRDDVAGIFDRLLTDSERASRQLAQDMAVLDEALRQGQISRAQYDQAVGGVAAEDLQRPRQMEPLSPMADGRDIARMIKESTAEAKLQMEAIQEKLNASAAEFGQRFADAMGAALDGDLRGVFYAFFGDVFRNAMESIGQSLFRSFSSGGKGGGFNLGAILGGLKLPGFANGGSFRVGGTGGVDSQIRMIRATPNERVTVTKPGQFPNGPRPMVFDMRGAVVTADLLAQVNQRVASGEARAVRTATDVARRSAPGMQQRLRALGTT